MESVYFYSTLQKIAQQEKAVIEIDSGSSLKDVLTIIQMEFLEFQKVPNCN